MQNNNSALQYIANKNSKFVTNEVIEDKLKSEVDALKEEIHQAIN